MHRNVGKADTVIRIIIAAVVAGLIITGNLSGTWAIIAGILAFILLVTGITGFCGIYKLLGISTNKK